MSDHRMESGDSTTRESWARRFVPTCSPAKSLICRSITWHKAKMIQEAISTDQDSRAILNRVPDGSKIDEGASHRAAKQVAHGRVRPNEASCAHMKRWQAAPVLRETPRSWQIINCHVMSMGRTWGNGCRKSRAPRPRLAASMTCTTSQGSFQAHGDGGLYGVSRKYRRTLRPTDRTRYI